MENSDCKFEISDFVSRFQINRTIPALHLFEICNLKSKICNRFHFAILAIPHSTIAGNS